MKIWWLTDSVRLGTERRAVEALAREETWFQLQRWWVHEGNLSAEGVISAHGRPYPVRLVFPDQFPDVPAWVEPQEDVRWTSHQYGTSNLCLEHRPDSWLVTTTGAEVLCSVYRLLTIEDPLGEGGTPAPSAHHIGDLQAYDWISLPVLMGAACHERIRERTSRELKALMWLVPNADSPILVYDSDDRQAPRRPSQADVHSWQFELPAFASLRSIPTEVADRAALVAAGGFDADTLNSIPDDGAILVLFAGGNGLAAYHSPREGTPRRQRVVVLPEQSGFRSGRSPGVESKTVAIVGAGSVGSKIAESLVRSGVSRLKLVDGDVLLPDNLERHALDWRDVGLRKVKGLERRLRCIVPGVQVDVIADNLNWQRSARTHAWQVASFADCDVVVDATGDPSTSLFLGAVADSNRRAFVSVEVFEGGIGGLVATCLPSRDPPFAMGRAAFLAWCDQQGEPPPEPACRPYEAIGDEGTPMVADDAAVTIIACNAARAVLDILDGEPAPLSSAWLLFGFRRSWIFEGHGHTLRISVGERAAAKENGEDAEAKDFAEALLREYLREVKGEA